MTPIIEKLLQIQEQDIRITRLEREIADLPKRKAEIEQRLEEHRKAIHDAKEALKAQLAEMKNAETDVEGRRQGIRKLREQQMQVKTNREFKAIEDEVATAGKGIRGVEDGMLDLMEKVEAAQTNVRAREKDLKVEEEAVRLDVAVMEKRGQAIAGELAQVVEHRKALAAEADPAWLEPYDRIFRSKKDRGLVPVENGICSGCHMKLPPYLCHEARKQVEIVSCEFCGRMLC